MQELKRKIEAVLFTIGRPVTVAQVMELAKYNKAEDIQKYLDELVSEYSNKESSIEILKDNNRYRMNIKSDFMPLVKDLMPNTELDRPTIATLAVISWKQPILQSRVVKIRGNTAYEHVKLLEDLGFVTTERQGLSKAIKLSPKFYEYFDTNKEELQRKLSGDKKQITTEVPDLLANIQNTTNIPMPNTTQIELPKVTNVDIPNVTNIEMPGTPEITIENPLQDPQPPKVGIPKKEHKENTTQIETPQEKEEKPKEKKVVEEKDEKQDLEKLKETNTELFDDLEEGTEVVLNKNV